MEKKPRRTGGDGSTLVKLYQRGVGKALIALAISAVAVGSAAGCGGNGEGREAARGPSGSTPGVRASDVAPPNVTMEQAAGGYASMVRRGPDGILSSDAVPHVPSPDVEPLEIGDDAAVPWVDLPKERDIAGVGVFEEIDEEPAGTAEGPAYLASADGAAKDPSQEDAGRSLPVIELEPASFLVATERGGQGAGTAADPRGTDGAGAARGKPREEGASHTTQGPSGEQKNGDASPATEAAEEESRAAPIGEPEVSPDVVPEQQEEPPAEVPPGGEEPVNEVPLSLGEAPPDGEDSVSGGTVEGTAPVTFEEPAGFSLPPQPPESAFVQTVGDAAPTPETPAQEPASGTMAGEVPVAEVPAGGGEVGDAPEGESEGWPRGDEAGVRVGEVSPPFTPGQEQPPSTPEATLVQPPEGGIEGEVGGDGTTVAMPSGDVPGEPAPESTRDASAVPAPGGRIDERHGTDAGSARGVVDGKFVGPAGAWDQGSSGYEALPATEGGPQGKPDAAPAGEPAAQAPPSAQTGALEEFTQQPTEPVAAQPMAQQPVPPTGEQQPTEERWIPGDQYEVLPSAAQSPATEQEAVAEPVAPGYYDAQPVYGPAAYEEPAYGTDQYAADPVQAASAQTAYDVGEGPAYHEQPQVVSEGTATEQSTAAVEPALQEEPAYEEGSGVSSSEPASQSPAAQEGAGATNPEVSGGEWEAGMGSF